MSAGEKTGGRRGRAVERALVLATCLAVGLFYGWTVRTSSAPWNFGAEQRDYYNLLIDGWLDGQLHLKVEVPEALLAVADPYDPAQRPPGAGLHDASFYRGKYFLYFGAAPVVTLMWPFRLVTGVDLPLPAAILVFVYAGFLVSAALLLDIRARYFGGTGTMTAVAILLALATASMVPLLLRRPSIWELPLSSGYFFAMAAAACVYRSFHVAHPLRWLAGASASLGLAVASRPTYLFAGLLLAIPVVWQWWNGRGSSNRGRETLRRAAAAFGPIALIGLAIGCYNYARFGSPTEFGVRYLLSGIYEAKARHFGADYAGFNLWLYLLQPATWSWYFPFVRASAPPPFPPGYFGFEFVFGLLASAPLFWLLAAAPFAPGRDRMGVGSGLQPFLLAAAGMAAGMTFILVCFYAAMGRYQSDFAPTWALLAGVGALVFAERIEGQSAFKRAAGKLILGGALAISILFGVVASMELYGNLQRARPAMYARIATLANYPSHWRDRLMGAKHGPLELELRLPPRLSAAREVLVATGSFGAADAIFLEDAANGRLRVGFRHVGGGETLSRPLEVDRTQLHRLRIEMGSLLPPEAHPFFRDDEEALRPLTRRLAVELDGELLLEGYQRFHPASSAAPEIASDKAAKLAGMPRFSGVVLGRKRDADYAALAARRVERLIQRVRLPPEDRALWQPLFSTVSGVPLVGAAQARGAEGVSLAILPSVGAPQIFATMPVDPAAALELEWVAITTPEGTSVTAKLGGTPVGTWRAHQTVSLADARIGLAAEARGPDVAERFGGVLFSSEYLAQERATEFAAVRLRVLFPAGEKGRREPLVVTGEPGRGDLFFVEYLDERRVRFGLDHWGKPPLFSEAIELDRAHAHELTLALGSFPHRARPADAASREQPLRLSLDGRNVWAIETRLFPVEASDVFIARNPIGGTACEPAFGGSVLAVEYLDVVH
jgi:hypothetical protein